ncbi:hypothetical protein [Streptomyces sp. LaPpAH-108]|uniref:hypothetical protein n=1 Tax=Streptomyces sp. LaPpAH-108 TaxID=1155714 RepID=UPI001F1911FD|nr:hypothetical protein [Streptomyces sp. LaPpAH-108]
MGAVRGCVGAARAGAERSRTGAARLRVGAVAAGVVGALVLTGCGGGGGDDSTDSSPTASAAPTAGGSATGDGSEDGGGGAGAVAEIQGSWITTSGGKIVALVITGKQAGLFATGGAVCSGTAGEEADMRMVRLTCKGDSGHRSTGMVDAVTKNSLKITWSGRPEKETYTRAEGGTLPSGFPSELPSGLG